MKFTSITRPEQHAAKGSALVTAIILLTVLAGLGAFMASVSTNQQMTSAVDLEGTRAYWAARAGADYALMQLLQPEDTSGPTTFANCMTVPQTVSLPGISGFTVQITQCQRGPTSGSYSEDGLNVVVYTVTALASTGSVGGVTHVEREVSVSAAKCKDPNALLADGVTVDTRYRCL